MKQTDNSVRKLWEHYWHRKYTLLVIKKNKVSDPLDSSV